MPAWVNWAVQLANGLTQLLGFMNALPLDPEWKDKIRLGIALVAGAVGIIAHHYNTDGTPQTVPFVPPEK